MENFLTLMLMAMLVDGKVHDTEVQLIKNYSKLYPRFDGLSEERIQTSAVELNRKLNSGFDEKTVVDALLQEMKEKLSEADREKSYALASEICASNFEMHLNERKFLSRPGISITYNVPPRRPLRLPYKSKLGVLSQTRPKPPPHEPCPLIRGCQSSQRSNPVIETGAGVPGPWSGMHLAIRETRPFSGVPSYGWLSVLARLTRAFELNRDLALPFVSALCRASG
jgi:hypothetical protein